MSILSRITQPFSNLFKGYQKTQQTTAGRQFIAALNRIDVNDRGPLLALLNDHVGEISFQRYNPRAAEKTEYRGQYPRYDDLYNALYRAHAAIYAVRGMGNEDIKESPNREYTLDYFLSDAANYSISPDDVFVELLALMVETETLLGSMELTVQKEHYLNHYQTMRRDGLAVLDALARLSDLAVA